MALFQNETLLAVANSNRFHANCECREHPEDCTANVAILDVSAPGSPTIQQIVPNPYNPNPNSPDFPRNVTVGPDDSTLYVPNASANDAGSDHNEREVDCGGPLAGDLQFGQRLWTYLHCPGSRLLEIKRLYATLGAAFFPRCNTTKIMCSEFSRREDSSPASKSKVRARV